MMTDMTLAELCKSRESGETDRRSLVGHPVYVRIDGSRFSRFTKRMERPFDKRMSMAMVETTKAIMSDYHSLIGYTQSDEITVVFYSPVQEIHHGGRFQKLASRLASNATAHFTILARQHGLSEFVNRRPPEFDARVVCVPSLVELAQVVRWRSIDARRNAIQMAAQSVCSHKQLQGKHSGELLELLAGQGIDFDSYPGFFRSGTFIWREIEERILTKEELQKIPQKHWPVGPVKRHKFMSSEPPESVVAMTEFIQSMTHVKH